MKQLFCDRVTALFYSVFTIGLSGCFIATEAPPEPSAVNFSFDLYMTRTSLTGTEFEQYKLLPMGLYIECGMIRRGRQVANQQGIHPVSTEARHGMGGVMAALADRYVKNPPNGLPSPGNNSDMFDPGKFTFSAYVDGHPISVKTSFDEIANSSNEFSQALVRLVETARGVSEHPPCKNLEFFGLLRRSVKGE